jgi:heptosyltransferase-3
MSVFLTPRPKREEKKKLLIVRIDGIGDFILFSPMLAYYRELYKEYEITLLVNTMNRELADRYLTDGTLDHVLTFDFDRKKSSGNFWYNRAFLKTIRDLQFSVTIYPVYSREIIGDYMIAVSGAREKIGYDGDYRNISKSTREKTDTYYTELILASPGILQESERNKEFVERLAAHLGVPVHITAYLPVFTPSVEDMHTAEQLLYTAGFDPTKKYMIVCPGSSSSNKNWPVEKFADLITQLHQTYGLEVIVGGSTQETATTKALQGLLPFSIIDLTGKTTLPVFGAVCKKAEIYIGNDTGTTHIAAATGLVTVCIVGEGIDRFFPYGNTEKNIAVYDETTYASAVAGDPEMRYKLMHGTEKNVTVTQVLGTIHKALEYTHHATN